MGDIGDFLKQVMNRPPVPAGHVCLPPAKQGEACPVCGGIMLAPEWSAAINAMPEDERKAFRKQFGIVEV